MTTKELLSQIPKGVYAPLAMPGAFYTEPIDKWPRDERERYLAAQDRMAAKASAYLEAKKKSES